MTADFSPKTTFIRNTYHILHFFNIHIVNECVVERFTFTKVIRIITIS